MTVPTIIGAAATQCGRFVETPLRSLAIQAIDDAIADAQIDAGSIDAVFVANALGGLIQGQECIRGEVLIQESRLEGKPVVNVENACASGSSALHLACAAVRSGVYGSVLVLGAEKMSHAEKGVALRALEGAIDVDTKGDYAESTSIFMDIYAEKARRHAERYGTTASDLAQVVVKNRRHASVNPIAQYRDETTVDAVLESRMIAVPLTLLMCSPVGDAASALVVTGESSTSAKGVQVIASAVRTGDRSGVSVVERAAREAYEQAGVEPRDIDVAEVHDASAAAEIEELEHLGFAAAGEGRTFAAQGMTSVGGRIPVNTSGGLISRGHPVGATGVLQVYELVQQLTGRAAGRQVEGARLALAQNAGGWLRNDAAVAVVTILARNAA